MFVVMAVLAVTTACGSNAGTDSSKSEKQESMETKETTKVVHLTKDESCRRYIIMKRIRTNGSMKVINLPL